MMPELFKTIVVDPPWLERGGGRITRGAQRHYELMDKSAIIRTITQCEHWNNIGVDAHLYLWVTNNHLPDGLEVMSALGFKYVTNVCWTKDRHGLGQYFRGQHEICLFGTRGKGYNVRTSDKSISTVVNARRTQHSRKPDAFYDMVERKAAGRISISSAEETDLDGLSGVMKLRRLLRKLIIQRLPMKLMLSIIMIFMEHQFKV